MGAFLLALKVCQPAQKLKKLLLQFMQVAASAWLTPLHPCPQEVQNGSKRLQHKMRPIHRYELPLMSEPATPLVKVMTNGAGSFVPLP